MFEAFDTELERKVALKLLRGGAPTVAARREGRAQAKLDHPAVVSIYDVGDAQGQAYIAMELMDPESFEAWASKSAPLDVLAALRRVAGGIEAAHLAGLVHGDIKPSNILRSSRGEAKLSDFCVARAQEGSEAVLAGTRAFMAPELFDGVLAGPSSDQYAFCVTAWQLFHGEHPWTSRGSQDSTQGAAPEEHSGGPQTGQPQAGGIAQQQRQQGDFEEALATTDEARRILRKTAPQDDTNLSSNAYSRAQTLAHLGRVEEARAAYEASIRHGKRANPGPSRNLATLQMSLARLYAEELELYEDAVVLADAGLRMHVEVLGERHPDLVISRGRYGQILGRAGRTEDARSEITRALALGNERLGPEHVDTIYVQLLLAGFELRAESFVAAETAAAAAVATLRELAAPPEGMLAAAEGLLRDARAAQGRPPEK